MGSQTTKGYPYPIGTDRVMDGDNAMQALAEAIDSDALFTHALSAGQSIAATTVTAITWSAATENGCGLTKTSGFVWTVTQAGLYVVGVKTRAANGQGNRSFAEVYAGSVSARAMFQSSETDAAPVAINRLIVGDIIKAEVYYGTASSVVAGGCVLNVMRLGRSTGAAAPA